MARGTSKMREIDAMIEEAESKLEGLQVEIATLRAVKQRLSGEQPAKPKMPAPRANVKRAVLDLLSENRHSGLNAAMAVHLAKQKGEDLDRGSVSSLLSRLKNDGVVMYDGRVYRLIEREPNSPSDQEESHASIVH